MHILTPKNSKIKNLLQLFDSKITQCASEHKRDLVELVYNIGSMTNDCRKQWNRATIDETCTLGNFIYCRTIHFNNNAEIV